ncbi:MAG: helix-turn-helix transcriptional regulator [Clostridia bacterium]|nr:helix-turn-helix transcriptional regulator [Clostridia bacterium]
MKISGSESEKTILIELGERIKQHRISLNITQAEMAEKCCVSSSTVTRIENGTDSMVSNYIKILSGLNLSGNINLLIPEMQPDFKSLYEKKRPRQRAKPSTSKSKNGWTWGEDK